MWTFHLQWNFFWKLWRHKEKASICGTYSTVRKRAKQKGKTPNGDYSCTRLAIQLHKIYNGSTMDDDWMDMNVQQNFNTRNGKFHITDVSRLKIGINIMCNRLKVLNDKINLDWLNSSLTSYKIKMKEIFLSNDWWLWQNSYSCANNFSIM